MTNYVITASVYVDGVSSPQEATDAVEELNNYIVEVNPTPHDVQIVLPDNNPERWEESGRDEEPVNTVMRDLEGHGNLEGR